MGCALLAAAGSAQAQAAWPTKPIVYVVPFTPGGNTDILARLLSQKLAAALGQPVVIENKPGAGGNIGSDFVAKSKPDGYTILGGTISSHAINPITRKPGACWAESMPLSGERKRRCAKDAALASCCHCPRMQGQARG